MQDIVLKPRWRAAERTPLNFYSIIKLESRPSFFFMRSLTCRCKSKIYTPKYFKNWPYLLAATMLNNDFSFLLDARNHPICPNGKWHCWASCVYSAWDVYLTFVQTLLALPRAQKIGRRDPQPIFQHIQIFSLGSFYLCMCNEVKFLRLVPAIKIYIKK